MTNLKQGRIFRLTKENVSKVPNAPGNYKYYNKDKKEIYVGTSKGNKGAQWGPEPHQHYKYGMRHRIQSMLQKDDHKEHPTKKPLRKDAKYFSYKKIHSHSKRRALEKQHKQGKKHNHL
jgi:hypothetical protein